MNVKAILWTNAPAQDGTCAVRFYVYAKGKKKYYPAGFRVHPENWSKSKQKVVGLPQYIKDSYNWRIERLREQFLKRLSNGAPVDKLLSKEEKEGRSLSDFLDLYISEIESGLHGISLSTVKTYRSVQTRLSEYCKEKGVQELTFDDIDMDWYSDYNKFIVNNQIGRTSFDKAIKILKKVMRIAFERNLHENRIYEHREFKRMRKKTEKIYLNKSEIKKIEDLDLNGMEHLARERDRFLISYYFIMRWKDSTLINEASIIDNSGLNYIYKAHKTGIKCTVPVSSAADVILKRRNYRFDVDSNQKSNFKIKEVCMLAGITDIVKENGLRAPKYKFVTSHTARRSAATNLYLEGMDLETIARIGGWKKLETLKKYLKASGLEVAQNARKFDFFK